VTVTEEGGAGGGGHDKRGGGAGGGGGGGAAGHEPEEARGRRRTIWRRNGQPRCIEVRLWILDYTGWFPGHRCSPPRSSNPLKVAVQGGFQATVAISLMAVHVCQLSFYPVPLLEATGGCFFCDGWCLLSNHHSSVMSY
jgi:hypothetical protein